MKHILRTSFLIAITFPLFAQNNSWIAFWNRDSTKIGFKDKNGTVKIKPKFMGVTHVQKFDYIVAVTEEINNHWNSYYLTKKGRKVGLDSLHFFDNGADCENEGFIRFHDPKTDKVGMFNANGSVAIPAAYNDLQRVKNGMTMAIKDAKKRIDGEHYSWVGGNELLIDTNNNVLIDDFSYNNQLNFFSLKITSKPSVDSARQNFKAKNGLYYSFIDYEKEFKTWLGKSFLTNLTKANLLSSSFKTITFWKESDGWISEARETFINRNLKLIQSKLMEMKSPDCDYSIFDEDLNPFIYNSPECYKYYDNCGEPRSWLYPVKEILINHKHNKDLLQNSFEFLRTEDGYKLISVSLGQGLIQ